MTYYKILRFCKHYCPDRKYLCCYDCDLVKDCSLVCEVYNDKEDYCPDLITLKELVTRLL